VMQLVALYLPSQQRTHPTCDVRSGALCELPRQGAGLTTLHAGLQGLGFSISNRQWWTSVR